MLLYGLEKDPDFGNLDMRLLVSCPSNGTAEGGLFYLDFERNGYKKLFTGSCMGMTWVGDRLIVSTDDNKLIAFNQQFQVIAKTKHRRLDFHGVAKLNDNVVLVVETAVNAIGCYEIDTFTRIGEIRLHPSDKDVLHINDVWLENNTLYVSMFSPNDKWYANLMNRTGVIAAVPLTDFLPNQRLDVNPAEHIVADGLYMPHTVMIYKDELAYCDSMSFRAVIGDQTTFQAVGFTRGLAFTDEIMFIGQSRMRHLLRIPREFTNCCLDGGIYVYNPELRISRFVPLPVQQVYQILVLPPDSYREVTCYDS